MGMIGTFLKGVIVGAAGLGALSWLVTVLSEQEPEKDDEGKK